MVWEIRTTGSPYNGGGFDPCIPNVGTDYSQQDANHFNTTTLKMVYADQNRVWNSTGTDFDVCDVGNILHISVGTGWTTLTGYYLVTAVDANAVHPTATLDRPVATTYTGSSGTACLGGAFKTGKAGSPYDSGFFSAAVAGNIIYWASGSYDMGASIAVANAGLPTNQIQLIGYKTTRTTIPYGADRPDVNLGTYSFSFKDYWLPENLSFRNSPASIVAIMVTIPVGLGRAVNCSFVNSSTTADRIATSNGASYYGCQVSCPRGVAIYFNTGYQTLKDCYIYDSNIGLDCYATNLTAITIADSVIDTCVKGINFRTPPSGLAGSHRFTECVFRNCGTAINIPLAGDSSGFINNILSDNYIGLSVGSIMQSFVLAHNCWNNTTDIANDYVPKGHSDITADPLLASGIAKGSDGVIAAGKRVFTSATAVFTGVTAGSDRFIIHEAGSGTHAIIGVYDIASVDSATQITLASNAGDGTEGTGVTFGVVKGTDYTLQSTSPCINTAERVNMNSELTGTYKKNIGVCQTNAATSTGDLNEDYKVDFADFAIMALHWLECSLDPPSACWE